MEEIATLTRDVELLRSVRSYTEFNRPTDRAGQVGEIGSQRWRDRVEARLEVLDRADMLVRITGHEKGASPAIVQPSGATTAPGHTPLDRDREIVRGWLGGGWTHEQMRDSGPCMESEAVRLHAARYLKAREFFAATGERLAAWREEGMSLAASPALDRPQLDRLDRLAGGVSAVMSDRERTLLLNLAAAIRSQSEASPREIRWLGRVASCGYRGVQTPPPGARAGAGGACR